MTLFCFNEEGAYIHGSLYLLIYIVPFYYVFFAAAVLVKNQVFFNIKQKLSIGAYIVMCLPGPFMQEGKKWSEVSSRKI